MGINEFYIEDDVLLEDENYKKTIPFDSLMSIVGGYLTEEEVNELSSVKRYYEFIVFDESKKGTLMKSSRSYLKVEDLKNFFMVYDDSKFQYFNIVFLKDKEEFRNRFLKLLDIRRTYYAMSEHIGKFKISTFGDEIIDITLTEYAKAKRISFEDAYSLYKISICNAKKQLNPFLIKVPVKNSNDLLGNIMNEQNFSESKLKDDLSNFQNYVSFNSSAFSYAKWSIGIYNTIICKRLKMLGKLGSLKGNSYTFDSIEDYLSLFLNSPFSNLNCLIIDEDEFEIIKYVLELVIDEKEVDSQLLDRLYTISQTKTLPKIYNEELFEIYLQMNKDNLEKSNINQL